MSDASPLLYAYLVSFLVPPTVLLLDRWLLNRSLRNLRSALLSTVLIFGAIVGTAFLYEHHLKRELAAFDLDEDGVFSGQELSSEQDQALSRVANDVSRTFAPITGGLFALTYSGIFFGVVWAVSRVRGGSSGAA